MIILADGFEEVEAVTPIDFLRRAGIEVVVAGLDKRLVTGSRAIQIQTDISLHDFQGLPDVLILPGGKAGADRLHASKAVSDLIQSTYKSGKIIAAICASPAVVLLPSGVLDGKTSTCYPGFQINFGTKTHHSEERVVRDGQVITSKGPGTAAEFSYEIARALVGDEIAQKVSNAMLIHLQRSDLAK